MKAEKNPPRSEGQDESRAAFGRFESLARRLVAVPKKEIDRRARARDRKKSA